MNCTELGGKVGKLEKAARPWWDPKSICSTIADGHKVYLLQLWKTSSVKHMVFATRKGGNSFCGLAVMKSRDNSITGKELKAWATNSDKSVFLFRCIYSIRALLVRWFGRSVGGTVGYACHRWDGLRGKVPFQAEIQHRSASWRLPRTSLSFQTCPAKPGCPVNTWLAWGFFLFTR